MKTADSVLAVLLDAHPKSLTTEQIKQALSFAEQPAAETALDLMFEHNLVETYRQDEGLTYGLSPRGYAQASECRKPRQDAKVMARQKQLAEFFDRISAMHGLDPKDVHTIDRLFDRIGNTKHQHNHLSETIRRLLNENAELRNKLQLQQKALDDLQPISEHPLHLVFDAAVEQATHGKGEERHGAGKPFWEQPWAEITETVGTGFPYGQALKKLGESMTLPTPEARRAERLGAIVYIAMGLLYEDRQINPGDHP